ncbi:MAG: DMT family transporter [Deltaproteobacteria bacterium]
MRLGVLTAIAAAVMFGVSAPIIAWAGRGVFATACLLYAGAALVGHGARAVRRDRTFSLHRADAPRLVAIAVAGAALAPVLLVVGLERAGALTSSLLLNLEAVFTVVLAAVIHRELIGGRVWIAVGLMASGGAALSLDAALRGTGSVIGATAVLGATLAWALDNTLTQPLSDRQPFDVVAAKATLGAALTGVLALALGDSWPDLARVAALLACGATAYGLSLALYILAQRRIGAARTGSVFALAPFIGALVAWLAGDRVLGVWAVAAIALFAVGVWLHLSEQHRHRHHHSAVAHDHVHRHDDGHHTHDHDPAFVGEHAHPHQHAALDHDHLHDHGDSDHAHDHA